MLVLAGWGWSIDLCVGHRGSKWRGRQGVRCRGRGLSDNSGSVGNTQNFSKIEG